MIDRAIRLSSNPSGGSSPHATHIKRRRAAARTVGRALVAVGVLLFLFVAYQLWGTGLAEERAQRALRSDFEARLSSPPTLPVPEQAATAPTPIPPPELGEAMARLEIPRLDLEKLVVEGVGVEDLKKGPGHYPGTALPGERGNMAIAGHRTTYGAPFYRLDELEEGDAIVLTSVAGRFRYEVRQSMVVTPEDVWVLDPSEEGRLTLTTCHPRYSAAQRLIVVATLVDPPPAPRATPSENGTELLAPGAGWTAPPVLEAGLSGASAPRTPAVVWGAAAATVWFVAWLVARRRSRLVVYGVALVPFLVALANFYANVARLLPANV